MLSRRKLVVVPMAVLAVASLIVIYEKVPPAYRATGSIVLLSPPAPADSSKVSFGTSPNNPYTRFGDLSVVVDILVRIVNSVPAASRLQAQGVAGTYTIGANITYYHGPIIDISDLAPTGAEAVRSTQLVIDEAAYQLKRLQTQQGANPQYLIKSQTVVAPRGAKKVTSGTMRKLIALAVLDLLVVLGVASVAEAIATRRSNRTRAGDEPEGQDEWTGSKEFAPSAERPILTPVAGPRNHNPIVALHAEAPLRVTKGRPEGNGHMGRQIGRST